MADIIKPIYVGIRSARIRKIGFFISYSKGLSKTLVAFGHVAGGGDHMESLFLYFFNNFKVLFFP